MLYWYIFFLKCYYYFIVHIYIFEIFYRTKAKHSGGLLVDDVARERGAGGNVNKSHGRKQGDYAFLEICFEVIFKTIVKLYVYILQLKCVQYWPNLQTSIDCGSFSIHSMEEKEYAFYNVRKFTVINKKV